MTDQTRLRPQHGYLLIFGLSRAGTNLHAQRVHGLSGVISLSETASRFVLPDELAADRGLALEAIREGSLPPRKDPTSGFRYLCLNKINYALRVYPEQWLQRAAEDGACRSLLLVRNPFEIHRSRVNWVRRFKRQRVRWTEVSQLAREWMEFCRIAVELLPTGRARLLIHERHAGDRPGFVEWVSELCGERFEDEHADSPKQCLTCYGPLERRQRYDWDPNLWLYCSRCDLFMTGFGNYNFIRQPALERFSTWKDRVDLDGLRPK